MPELTRTQKLEGLRRWLEGVDALRGLFVEADKAERFLAESKGAIEDAERRATMARRDADLLITRRDTLAAEMAGERERLLAPVLAEQRRLEHEAKDLVVKMANDRKAFEEEVGRRTSVIRTLEEQTQTAQRAHLALLRKQQDDAEAEKARIRGTIEELKAREAVTREELERARAEYQSVLDAASRLVRRA